VASALRLITGWLARIESPRSPCELRSMPSEDRRLLLTYAGHGESRSSFQLPSACRA
jgi:hypothetical protein